MALQGTKALERWCKVVTEGYEGVSIVNMSTSWRSGLGFCAVIHHFRPDLLDFSSLDPEDALGNNRLAFEVAEQHLGIPALLDPQDMVELELLDRLSILTYLSQFFQVFRGSTAKGSGRPQRTGSSRSASEVGSPAKIKASLQPGGGRRLNEPCRVCGKPVFILERLNVGGRLLHRTCFRCARCRAQLNVVSYYETEAGQFCCDVCPDEEVSMAETVKANKEIVEKHLESGGDTSDSSLDSEGERDPPKDAHGTAGAGAGADEDAENSNTSAVDDNRDAHGSNIVDANDNDAKCLPHEIKASDPVPEPGAESNDEVTIIDSNSKAVAVAEAEAEAEAEGGQDSGGDAGPVPAGEASESEEFNENTRCHEGSASKKAAATDEDDHDDEIQPDDNLPKMADDPLPGVQSVQAVATEEPCSSKSDECDDIATSTDESQNKKADFSDRKSNEKAAESFESLPQEEAPKVEALEAEEEGGPLESEQNGSKRVGQDSEADSDVFVSADDGESRSKEAKEVQEGSPSDQKEDPSELQKGGSVGPVGPGEYPVEMNPFEIEGDEEHSSEGDSDSRPDERKLVNDERNTEVNKKSTNPFASDFEESSEEEDGGEAESSSSVANAVTTSKQGTPLVGPPKPPRAAAPASSKSLNPFGSDFEDDDEEEEEYDEDAPRRTSSPCPSSGSSARSRKKRPAPQPPGMQRKAGSITPVPSPRTSAREKQQHQSLSAPVPAPRHSLSPASRKKTGGQAPSPQPVPPTSAATPNRSPAPVRKAPPPPRPPPPSDAAKERKERDNQKRRSQMMLEGASATAGTSAVQSPSPAPEIVLTPLSPNKAAVEGQWKRKKGPAPPRPIPQKRQVKKLPRKAVNTELHDIEVKQRELERQGVKLERTIRELCERKDREKGGSEGGGGGGDRDSLGPEEEDLIIQLFDLVNEKNDLFRRQTELVYMKRDHRLEEEHADIEHQVRGQVTFRNNSFSHILIVSPSWFPTRR